MNQKINSTAENNILSWKKFRQNERVKYFPNKWFSYLISSLQNQVGTWDMASVQADEILIFKQTEIPESVFYIPSSFNGYGSQKVLFKLHSTVFGHIFECNNSLKLSDFDTQVSVKQAKMSLSHELETGSSSSPSPFKNSCSSIRSTWRTAPR